MDRCPYCTAAVVISERRIDSVVDGDTLRIVEARCVDCDFVRVDVPGVPS